MGRKNALVMELAQNCVELGTLVKAVLNLRVLITEYCSESPYTAVT
jgi:hypothetical protein